MESIIKNILLEDDTNFNKLFELTLDQMLMKDYKISSKRESKSTEIATKKVDAGNKLITTLPLSELIKIYSEAIRYAPSGSEILARAYANRSAVLTNNAMYEDSLKDIERALNIGYPDNLKAKLYARKAKNLFGLANKKNSQVEEAMNQTYKWIEKIDDSNKKRVLSTIDKLQTQSLKKPDKKWDSSIFMPELASENPKILRASDAIEIQNSEKFGRHIVATRNVNAGEALMIHKAYSAILKQGYWHTFCWKCIKYTFSCVPCNHCTNVVFCDEKCRDEAWKEHHDMECSIIAGLDTRDEKIDVNISSLRLLTKALKEYGNIDALFKKVQELDLIKDSIGKSFTEGIFDDTKYASVYALEQNDFDSIRAKLYMILTIETLYMLAATTEVFGKKIEKLDEIKDLEYGFFIGKLLYQHIAIFRTNHISMMPCDDKGNVIKCAGALLPLLSLFSHSCDCNVIQYASGNISAIIPIQPIKKGEQICINYGMYYRDASTSQRRKHLMETHNFRCECVPCTESWGPSYRPPTCLMQIGARRNKNKILQIMEKYDKFPPIANSPEDILKTISELIDSLNTYGKYVTYPCAEMEHAKNLLLNIYRFVGGY